MNFNKIDIFLVALLAVFVAGGIYFYKVFDPSTSGMPFPKCFFYVLTGYKCPGCGMQRALHQLLNGNLAESVRQNALIYFAIPYVVVMSVAKKSAAFKEKFPRLSLFFNGYRSTLLVAVMVLAFWVLRNVWGF